LPNGTASRPAGVVSRSVGKTAVRSWKFGRSCGGSAGWPLTCSIRTSYGWRS